VVDDYVTREIVTEVSTLIDGALQEQGIELDEPVREKLLKAALEGHARLTDSGHPGRFDNLLRALIDLVAKEKKG